MQTRTAGQLGVMVLVLAFVTSACAAAVGAAAGAAAAIAYDDRNASTEIGASVSEVASASEAVFGEMGIEVTNRSAATDGSEAQIRGRAEGLTYRVDIDRASPTTTRVVVTAREGELGYRPSRAGQVLQRIIDRTS
jgi:hypothetical protein